MFPIILHSKNPDKKESFIQDFITKQKIPSFYIFRISPIKTEISIDQMRSITKEIKVAVPSMRLFIVYDFDTASIEAQNALLKTLEEKNQDNQFILIVSDLARILPTIHSRSKVVSLEEVVSSPLNESVEHLLQTLESTKEYSFLTPVTSITREDSLKLFDHIIMSLKKRLPDNKTISTILKKALQQKKLLQDNNLNPQLAVDSFLLFYKKNFS